jgi:hypothetical protein
MGLLTSILTNPKHRFDFASIMTTTKANYYIEAVSSSEAGIICDCDDTSYSFSSYSSAVLQTAAEVRQPATTC